ERCLARLTEGGRSVLIPRELPPNDGAISYGQAVVTAARLASGERPPHSDRTTRGNAHRAATTCHTRFEQNGNAGPPGPV
ncbi:MAG TPA: hypothetical protein VEJ23_06375, partial [Solirubrobacteraceae bacterium]|nr:hypothetical protein [Solirubrobacteraceae bacterium]